MDLKKWKECLQIPCHTSEFFNQVFFHTLDSCLDEPLVQLFDLKNEAVLCSLCESSGLQDSLCLKSERRARLAANYLIDEKGDLNLDKLDSFLSLLEKGYIFYPNGSSDAMLKEHLQKTARQLQENENLRLLLKQFRLPLGHKNAEDLVKASLGLFANEPLTNSLLRKSVLSACFSFLRQNVGSCFATAPAILIQSEQLEHLLSDLLELLSTGKLKKTFSGIEYSVPLSPSSGAADLHKKVDFHQAFVSPGLMTALQAAELIDQRISIEEKIQRTKELIEPFSNEKGLSVFHLLQKILLSHFSLLTDDLIAYTKLEESFIRNETLNQPTSPKLKAIPKFLEKEKKAHLAFKAIADHPLLKAWEFTLASFSEAKTDFSTWNLYVSLGLHLEQKEGIGEVILRVLQEKLDTAQEKVLKYQAEYEVAFSELKATESLLKRASTEAEIRRLQIEFNSRLHQLQTCLDIRDDAQKEASQCASFFPFLLEEYAKSFKEYFQEIYDADMQDVEIGPYEDSPAGFRLIYKHGRTNASLWTLIYSSEGYIKSLTDFFLAIEREIGKEQNRNLITDITSAIISHIQTEKFLQTAFSRMAEAHRTSLPQNQKYAQKKPWAYTSGGSMVTLLQTYYKKENPLTVESFWAENEIDLLVRIITTLKMMPSALQEEAASDSPAILMSSPTHAFLLHPSLSLLRQGWQEDLFSYSWVRDQVVHPRKEFYQTKSLSEEEQIFLLQELTKIFPSSLSNLLNRISSFENTSIIDFRNKLSQIYPIDLIDSFLYESLPLIPNNQWKQAVEALLPSLLPTILQDLPDTQEPFIRAKTLKSLAKTLYLANQNTLCFSFDLHEYVENKAAELGFSPPRPLLFADTNWSGNYLGFLVNPGTSQLELWRLDHTGSSGSKMSAWQRFLNGEDQSPWHIYTHRFEYR